MGSGVQGRPAGQFTRPRWVDLDAAGAAGAGGVRNGPMRQSSRPGATEGRWRRTGCRSGRSCQLLHLLLRRLQLLPLPTFLRPLPLELLRLDLLRLDLLRLALLPSLLAAANRLPEVEGSGWAGADAVAWAAVDGGWRGGTGITALLTEMRCDVHGRPQILPVAMLFSGRSTAVVAPRTGAAVMGD
jgi:hypothetical protein